jgi:vacuolar-type H+-ATPase subunit I/STV1
LKEFDVEENSKPINLRFPLGIPMVALIMILIGLAEIDTGLTHSFFEILTSQGERSTYLGVLLGLFYLEGGILIIIKRKWAAGVTLGLLGGDVIGMVAMVLFGLYPVNSFDQAFTIVVGTAIAIFFLIYIGLKWSIFR